MFCIGGLTSDSFCSKRDKQWGKKGGRFVDSSSLDTVRQITGTILFLSLPPPLSGEVYTRFHSSVLPCFPRFTSFSTLSVSSSSLYPPIPPLSFLSIFTLLMLLVFPPVQGRHLRSSPPSTSFQLLSRRVSEEMLLEGIRRGAHGSSPVVALH